MNFKTKKHLENTQFLLGSFKEWLENQLLFHKVQDGKRKEK